MSQTLLPRHARVVRCDLKAMKWAVEKTKLLNCHTLNNSFLNYKLLLKEIKVIKNSW